MELSKANVQFKFATPMLRQLQSFWAWWLLELEAVLPAPLRQRILPRTERVYLDLNGPILAVSHGTAETRRSLGTYPLTASGTGQVPGPEARTLIRRAGELVLCLPADKVLTKSLTLPLAAEENLREVLGFEMDRNTPFSAQQVYYDYIVTSREPKKQTITLDLVVTPRPLLDELLVQLDALGLHPQRVTARRKSGARLLPVNLHPHGGHNGHADTLRYVNLGLTAVLIALLIGAAAVPLLHKRQAIHALEAELAVTEEKSELAGRLREELNRLTSDTKFLLEKRQSTPLALEIITELTRILPDDTWITHLDIKGWEVNVQGESASAASLIPLIESSTVLSGARFRSPVTRTPRSDAERFILSAETRRQVAP